MRLTDEQFNALLCRLVERKAQEREGSEEERRVSDGEALAELGIKVETRPGKGSTKGKRGP